MDLQKIEKLLDAYFEGKTGIAEEQILHRYFMSSDVAPHLEVYRDMFSFFAAAKNEKAETNLEINRAKKPGLLIKARKWYAVAALLVLALGATFFVQNNTPPITEAERQEAEYAFEKTKEALNFFSYRFNESAQKLSVLSEFENSTNKIFK